MSKVEISDNMKKLARKKRRKPKNKNNKNTKNPPQKKKEEEEDDYESRSEEDYSDTQQERKNEYRKGGYHPVTEGELYNNRYRIVKKLGWGYFSTVWLSYDHDENNFKAIKIQKSAQHYRDAAYDEITLLSQIFAGDANGDKCCCRLHDNFEHTGPNGRHVVMVFEVLGENLLQLIMKYDYKGIPIPVVKNIMKQVLIGLDYLHRELKIIHTDLKPENVVIASPWKAIQKAMKSYVPPKDRYKQLTLAERDPSTLSKSQRKRLKKKLKDKAKKEDQDDENDDAKEDNEKNEKEQENDDPETLEEILTRCSRVKLVDFGNACWTHKHFTDDIQTRQYRAPEVIVRNPYHTSVDMWSCACLAFELLTGDFLFDPQESDQIDRDEDHLALIVELLQTQPQVPECLYARGSNEYINSAGYLRHINHLKFWNLPSVLHEKYKFTKEKALEIADFMLPMLTIDPRERATAQAMLEHPWLDPNPTDWDPYDHESADTKQHDGVPQDGEWSDEESEEEDDEAKQRERIIAEYLAQMGGEAPPGYDPEMFLQQLQQGRIPPPEDGEEDYDGEEDEDGRPDRSRSPSPAARPNRAHDQDDDAK